MAVVSRTSIKDLIKKGDIVVYPFTKEKIGNCSVDVRLGEWYFRQKQNSDIIFPYVSDDDALRHPWDPIPQRAAGADKSCEYVIGINPGEMILATTEEFIGSRVECTTMAKTKSTVARLGLDLFGSSGWGDIGYINRWAFPLHNRSSHKILLKPGTWIAQIVFFTVSDKELSYTQGGNYQSTDDFQKLVREWDPRSVLPKCLST